MPTRTAVMTADVSIQAHVPVDRFAIVDGPRGVNWLKVMETLNSFPPRKQPEFPLTFTLKTKASAQHFKRVIRLAAIFAVDGDTFNFTAIFANQLVSGAYNYTARTGWFNLD